MIEKIKNKLHKQDVKYCFFNTVDPCYLEYSISQNLLYLEQFIWFFGHLALDESNKILGFASPNILNFCLCQTNFPVP